MQVLRAEEHGVIPIRVNDSTRIRRDVLKRGWVQLRTGERDWSPTDTSFTEVPRALYAGSMAGLLPLSEDVAVLVEPRFPANLTHMVTAVGKPQVALDVVRAYSETPAAVTADWMLDHIVSDFLTAVEAVEHQGLLRDYLERRAATSSPKGRVLIGPTLSLQSSRGVDYRAEIAFHERTEDNPPNQALVEALNWCLAWTESRQEMKREWQRTVALLHTFRYVSRDRTGHCKQDPRVLHPHDLPESRSSYRRALPLAVALMERRGFSLDSVDGHIALSSLLVETDKVFEDFVRLRLSDYLPDRTLNVLDGNKMKKRPLFRAALPRDVPKGAVELPLGDAHIQPDVLIERGDTTQVVIDVKYKPVKGHAGREDVIEQLVTYAHRLDCGRAISVHPTQAGQSPGLFVSGRVGTTTLYNYRVNLGAYDLEGEMRRMAEVLGALASPDGDGHSASV